MNADRWIAVVSLTVGVGAVLFSYWVYRRGEKRRVPTMVAAPSTVVLVKPEVSRLKDFSVTHDGKIVGVNGVTATFIYFWNDGKLPILRADVTSPYTISLPKGVQILNLAVTRSTRPVLGIEAHVVSNEEGTDCVEISFSVLEPGDGLKVQIIFDGPSDSQVVFAGSCLGSSKVRVLTPEWTYFQSRTKRFEATYTPFMIALGLVAVCSGLGGLISLAAKFVGPSRQHYLLSGLLVLFGVYALWLAGIVLHGWYKRWSASSVPPEIRGS